MRNYWHGLLTWLTGRTYIPRIRYTIIGNTGYDRSMNTYINMSPW